MRILIVGAGAIGQVYAFHLKNAGHDVYFYVKEKYAAEMKGEQSIYPLNRKNPRLTAVSFHASGVLSTPEEVAGLSWDQVYLCMSSTGLRGPWLTAFSKAVGKATIIALQSGMEDRAYLLNYFPSDQIVSGMLSLISYHAPLSGEELPGPGMAYWFPPFSPSPFSGEPERTKAVVDALNSGGYPAKIVSDVPSMVAIPSAVLMNLMAGLELSDWSFVKFSEGKRMEEVCRAIFETAKIISKQEGKRPPFLLALLKPTAIKSAMKLAPCVIPLPIETYLKTHFTKVGDQTRMYMQGYVELGKKSGLQVEALNSLTEKLLSQPVLK